MSDTEVQLIAQRVQMEASANHHQARPKLVQWMKPWMDNAVRMPRSSLPKHSKFEFLRRAADKINETLSPHTACGHGCHHCCKQSVVISQVEADVISLVTGQANDRQVFTMDIDRDDLTRKYTGVPCPFLGEHGECSIYEHRPLICRVHHNLSKTPEVCSTEDMPGADVPMIDLRSYYGVVAATCVAENVAMADIRQFFPEVIRVAEDQGAGQ